MTSSPLFQVPDGPFYADLLQKYPCREQQIRTLATLLDVG